MAQDHGACFVMRFAGDPARQHLTDAAETHMTESVVSIVDRDHLAIFRACAFSNDDDRITRPAVWTTTQIRFTQTISQQLKHPLVTKRMLRYQNQMRLTGHTRPQREMPGVPSHHF